MYLDIIFNFIDNHLQIILNIIALVVSGLSFSNSKKTTKKVLERETLKLDYFLYGVVPSLQPEHEIILEMSISNYSSLPISIQMIKLVKHVDDKQVSISEPYSERFTTYSPELADLITFLPVNIGPYESIRGKFYFKNEGGFLFPGKDKIYFHTTRGIHSDNMTFKEKLSMS